MTDAVACMTPSADPSESPAPSNPPSLSARELHEVLVKCFLLGNRAQLKFLRALFTLDQTRLYLKLG
ncbi:MAG: hypothetical protein HY721_14390, partial [Planctomycetes bacterium]|nr:hypothetical protein [Planctomycetota bacterium]